MHKPESRINMRMQGYKQYRLSVNETKKCPMYNSMEIWRSWAGRVHLFDRNSSVNLKDLAISP